MYPEMTSVPFNSEFSGLVFYGEEQQHENLQLGSLEKYNLQSNYQSAEDMSLRNHAQLNSYASNTYQLLNSLDHEKRRASDLFHQPEIKQEFIEETYSNLNTFQSSMYLPEIQHISNNVANLLCSQQLEQTLPNSEVVSLPSDCEMSPPISTNEKTNDRKKPSRPRLYKFNPKPLTLNPQMKRSQTSSDDKNGDYWQKRKRNNEASRRSRLARRLKECMIMEEMKKLKRENDELKAELLKIRNTKDCRI